MASLHHTRTTYTDSRTADTEQTSNSLLQEQVLWKLLLLTGLAYLMWSDNISIIVGPVSINEATEQAEGGRVQAAIFEYPSTPKKDRKSHLPEVQVALPAGSLNNLTFAIDYAYARRNGIGKTEVDSRFLKCRDYVEKYAAVAVSEMQASGIPASITLAQGLLESNAGESNLARKTNNHFGIKCFSKRCKKGHCLNFTDDSHKDFFVKYASARGSFKAHSQFLQKSGRYSHLFDFDRTDYRNWAYGLGKAGYATDKQYGEKLVAIIQSLGLYRYDRQAEDLANGEMAQD